MINFNNKWTQHLSEIEFDTSNLTPKDELHPKFWKNNQLLPGVGDRLEEIAEDLIKNLDFDIKIEDIIITGSIATYNWHKLSDIDLHIMIDFSKIDENYDLIKKFLDAKKGQWNRSHEIMVFGHEVEVYFQDINEEHHAAGIYSLYKRDWLTQPTKESGEPDFKEAEIKAESLANEIDAAYEVYNSEKYSDSYDIADKLKKKIKKLRQCGLEQGGIYSPENLAFKLLRNSGFLGRLMNLKTLSYDKMMSINGNSAQNGQITVKIAENWSNFIKKQ